MFVSYNSIKMLAYVQRLFQFQWIWVHEVIEIDELLQFLDLVPLFCAVTHVHTLKSTLFEKVQKHFSWLLRKKQKAYKYHNSTSQWYSWENKWRQPVRTEQDRDLDLMMTSVDDVLLINKAYDIYTPTNETLNWQQKQKKIKWERLTFPSYTYGWTQAHKFIPSNTEHKIFRRKTTTMFTMKKAFLNRDSHRQV